jgi:hypothetical protein
VQSHSWLALGRAGLTDSIIEREIPLKVIGVDGFGRLYDSESGVINGFAALNWLNESIRLDSGNSQAWALRGFAELPASPADAERDFRQAATLNPANDLARAGLARLRSGN